ncbi:YqkE family protein [Planococcus lenghuensis]|uniref:DUF3886 domain-containing protein n=1 Tax=Planococcus lenghuensis TaxID=2213202 RepID=A0A1Q2KZP0_9BACL|nr:YqkE family protein [Planococcus lenghuensis]AQQ53668.1 hypothetical protein B0X71_11655 [Planococcus lenghuensis]
MAKKREETNGVFSEDVLAKLQNTKKELQQEERQRVEEAEAKRQFERKQREKNLSFEELLDRYGDQGSKF